MGGLNNNLRKENKWRNAGWAIGVSTVTLFHSCYSTEKYTFDINELDHAWQTNNKEVFGQWVESLGDSALPDGEFFARVADLSRVTNFAYGNMDVTDSVWLHKPAGAKKAVRKNIAIVYNVYLSSCLFANKRLSLEESLIVQKRFFKSNQELTTNEIASIQMEIRRLCRS